MPQTTSRGYPYPLYTDQADFPSQIQDLAEAIDVDVDGLYDRVAVGYNRPTCIVRAVGVNQAIAANTDVTATYAEEVYDNANMFNLGTSTTTVTFPESGIYIGVSRITFLSNGNATVGGRQVAISTTGTLGVVGRKSSLADQNVSTGVHQTVIFFAEAGSTVTQIQRHNSGASLNSSTRYLAVSKVSDL
jgi:ABC-type sulfate transport system substrate-binding protein